MKAFVVFASVILAAQGASVKQMNGWSSSTPAPSGWSSSTPAPTTLSPGWPSTAAPTTLPPTTAAPGWPSSSSPAPAGWGSSSPPPSGWQAPAPGWSGPSINTAVNLAAEAAAIGSGWAAENHAENIAASGDDVVPADVFLASGGEAVVGQAIDISQQSLTASDGSAYSSNFAGVENVAAGTEGALLEASGLAIAANQNGWSAGSGIGSIAADAQSNMSLNPGSGWSGNMGLSHN